jgi:hypothetical protein
MLGWRKDDGPSGDHRHSVALIRWLLFNGDMRTIEHQLYAICWIRVK